MNGDDITRHNTSLPWFPKEMNIFRRVQCLLGYHNPETRQSTRYGPEHLNKKRKQPLPLRDQCARCFTLLTLIVFLGALPGCRKFPVQVEQPEIELPDTDPPCDPSKPPSHPNGCKS